MRRSASSIWLDIAETPTNSTPAFEGALTVTPDGSVDAGFAWTLILNGDQFRYNAVALEDLTDVTKGLSGLINAAKIELLGPCASLLGVDVPVVFGDRIGIEPSQITHTLDSERPPRRHRRLGSPPEAG